MADFGIGEAIMLFSAIAATSASVYSADQNRKAQHQGQDAATANAKTAEAQAEAANNRANASGPDVGSALSQNTRAAAGGAGSFHFISQTHRLFNQSFNDLRFGNGLDDFALNKDLALAISRRNAKICFASFARTINNTAHNCNAKWNCHSLQASLDLLCQ